MSQVDSRLVVDSRLACAIERGDRLAILTGAGVSTGSGIPDYRDDEGQWKHAKPVMFQDFMTQHSIRQRYWARSMLGWPRMAKAQPGAAHRAITSLQRAARVQRLITQNVDSLHQRAGSNAVIDLHGRLDEVRCMDCQLVLPRSDWQQSIAELNPHWQAEVVAVRDAPDGDAILERADYGAFAVPDCPTCGGIVKPEVVFFGENVPRLRVEAAYDAVARADGLLVAGSSLMVFSGFRFARRCVELGKPLYLLNRGKTRADDIATEHLYLDCGDALSAIVEQLEVQ
ncbi:MAG: NAD-dependent protein deacetylase [Pseudomonadota bacterium]